MTAPTAPQGGPGPGAALLAGRLYAAIGRLSCSFR
jgi:hypothetical protein